MRVWDFAFFGGVQVLSCLLRFMAFGHRKIEMLLLALISWLLRKQRGSCIASYMCYDLSSCRCSCILGIGACDWRCGLRELREKELEVYRLRRSLKVFWDLTGLGGEL